MVNHSTTVIDPLVIDPQLNPQLDPQLDPHDLRDPHLQDSPSQPQNTQDVSTDQNIEPVTSPLVNSLLDSPPQSLDLEYPGAIPRRVKVYILNGEDWLDNGTGYCVGEVTNCPYFLVRNELDSKDIILRSSLEGAIQFQRQQETLIVWTDLDGKDLALSFQEVDGCNDLCEFIKLVQLKGLSPNISLYYITTNLLENGEDQTELIAGPIAYPPAPSVQNLKTVLQLLNQNLNSKFIKTKLVEYMIEENFLEKLLEVFDELETVVGGKKTEIQDSRVPSTAVSHKIPKFNRLMDELVVDNAIFKHPSFEHLLSLYEIFKTLVLFNVQELIEEMLKADILFGVVGVFEYDSIDSKAFHRSNLVKKSFKVILPIANLQIFKTDFYLNFIKDVVLVKILDDRVSGTLSNMIFSNQLEVIDYLKGGVLQQLFGIYTNKDLPGNKNHVKGNGQENTEDNVLTLKRDGVRMLHQYVLIAKSLQVQQRHDFFTVLVRSGLFRMICFALDDDDKKIRELGTELIVIIIEQDASLVNSICEEREDHLEPVHKGDKEVGEEIDEETAAPIRLKLSDDMTLISILAKVLVEDNNPGLRLQAVEALKILLDRNISSGPENEDNVPFDRNNGSMFGEGDEEEFKEQASSIPAYCRDVSQSSDFTHVTTANYFRAFYTKVAPQLFQTLIEASESGPLKNFTLYQHLCDLVTFCFKEHDAQFSQQFFLESHVLLGVSRLLGMRCKLQLKLSALKCLKNIVLLNDDLYTQYFVKHGILDHFFKYFSTIASANHVVNSSCLDFMEIIVRNCDSNLHIKRHNFKLLAEYIYNNYKEFCEKAISYVSTGRELIELVEHDFYEDSTCNGSYLQAVRNEIIDDSDDFIGKNETISDGEESQSIRGDILPEEPDELVPTEPNQSNTHENVLEPVSTPPPMSNISNESLIKHAPKKRGSRNIFSENSSKKIALGLQSAPN